MCRLSWNLEASASWNPQGLSRPVMGLLHLYLLCIQISLHGNNAMNSYVLGGQSPTSHLGHPRSFYRNPHVVCGKRSCTETGFFFRSSSVNIASLIFHNHFHTYTILITRTSEWRNAVADIGDIWVEKYLHVVFLHAILTVYTDAVWSKYENHTTFINDVDPEDRSDKFLRNIDIDG